MPDMTNLKFTRQTLRACNKHSKHITKEFIQIINIELEVRMTFLTPLQKST